jgi:predicted ABC-type ATPase
MPNLYIIAGCNGAGKTTASYTLLPEILNCPEFVNADNIARGLSPFNVEGVAIEAARIMLTRLNELLAMNVDFALETTLSTKSYVSFIKRAKLKGYKVHLIFFWLNSIKLAKLRVEQRVIEGGHNIPSEVIERRYKAGIKNFNLLYKDIVDDWRIFDNSSSERKLIAEKFSKKVILINEIEIFRKFESNG